MQRERDSESASVPGSKVSTYLGLVSRVGGVAQVTGSGGEAAVSLHQLVLWEAAHWKGEKTGSQSACRKVYCRPAN